MYSKARATRGRGRERQYAVPGTASSFVSKVTNWSETQAAAHECPTMVIVKGVRLWKRNGENGTCECFTRFILHSVE